MEPGCARYRDDKPQLPTLSLGLSSVQFIVNRIEAEYAGVVHTKTLGVSREIVKYNPNLDEGYEDYGDFPLGQPRGRVWNRILLNLGVALSRCVPSVTFGNFGVLAVLIGLCAPKMISYLVVYPFCRLVFGTLYPAYASYKAVRTKNLKEYVKWMMYWIVFALFTCTETFTDVFLSWFPFYYEVKIVLVLWLLSPATKGSSILYRRFVHPALCRREQEIDEYIAKAKDQGYHTVLNLGTKGVNYATTVIMQTAIKGGGGLVQQLRKSYSLSDLSECEPREERSNDEADDVLTEPRVIRRGGKTGYNTRRSASESNSRSPMYFPEVDVDVRTTRSSKGDEPDFSHIKSSEDISSGYSSADNSASLTRTASLGASARARARTTRTNVTTIKRPQAAEESEVIIEELHEDDSFEYANMPPLVNLPSQIFLSHTNPPFIYQYVGDQVKILQVLDNFIVNTKVDDTYSRDQTKTTEEFSQKPNIDKEDSKTCDIPDSVTLDNSGTSYSSIVLDDDDNKDNECNVSNKLSECKSDIIDEDNTSAKLDTDIAELFTKATNLEPTTFETSFNENYSAESDDEASFGTPEDSPRAKRKSPKGKYGKTRAPPPPRLDEPKKCVEKDEKIESNMHTTSLESLNDIITQQPDISYTDGRLFKGINVINPISEKKRRHKSKSPCRIPKAHSSGISKLLQLPNKLAFWHRTEDKTKSDNMSTSSGDNSRRSSIVEKQCDEFQSCVDFNVLGTSLNSKNISESEIADDQISFKDATDHNNELISNDIIEKSDALLKLIEAKIESHPEYKYLSLHEEIPTTSKSTDV